MAASAREGPKGVGVPSAAHASDVTAALSWRRLTSAAQPAVDDDEDDGDVEKEEDDDDNEEGASCSTAAKASTWRADSVTAPAAATAAE